MQSGNLPHQFTIWVQEELKYPDAIFVLKHLHA